ncbi:hypothetical protein CRM22_008691 [Opisthorchis felineus]|uniref:Translocon-associated protein subunit beta n=1 Tax=Opisthorchis felineus TaxID=147828 RepID=A0A4S2LI97_OPIFE|nr:hypothetical protein CRM22_008691 [Opisthorchis felineus]
MVLQVFFSCAFLFVTVSGQASDVARLAVSKQVLNEYIFQGKELTILYTIYNLHSSRPARDVELFDSYSDTEFIQIHGSKSARWPHISAGTNVTHAVVLLPQAAGTYNFTSATITYNLGDPSKTIIGEFLPSTSIVLTVFVSECMLIRLRLGLFWPFL